MIYDVQKDAEKCHFENCNKKASWYHWNYKFKYLAILCKHHFHLIRSYTKLFVPNELDE